MIRPFLTWASTPQWEPGLHMEQMVGRTSMPLDGGDDLSFCMGIAGCAYHSLISHSVLYLSIGEMIFRSLRPGVGAVL
jgi:hypothetical protein